MPRKKLRLSPAVAKGIAVLLGVSVVVFAELGARLFSPATRLDNILAVLRQDPELIWGQRPNLRRDFFGTEVFTDGLGLRVHGKRGGGDRVRVLSMGASPTFGWGVDGDETYSAVLGKRLASAFGGNVETVNGGNIGYSSHQGLKFLKRHWVRLDPDIVTVSYVINDVDSYRFFRSDGRPDWRLGPGSGTLLAARDFLSRFALFRLLEKAAGRLRGITAPPGMPRVSILDYRENLRAIAEFVRAEGAEVVFVKFPVNLLEPLPAPDPAKAERLLEEGLVRFVREDCAGAEKSLLGALAADPNLSLAYYYLGVCSRKFGREGEAESYFEKVKRAESRRCRVDAVRYNAVMARLARAEKIPLVDIVRAFNRSGGALFVDPKLDPIHPNERGHRIIADRLFAVVKPLVAARLRRQHRAVPTARHRRPAGR